MDKNQVESKLKETMNRFNFVGQVSIYENGKLNASVNTGKNTYYPMHKYSDLFINLLIIKGLEKNNISFESTIDLVLPDLKHSKKISFLNILRDQSGLIDLHGVLTTQYQKEEFYSKFDEDEKMGYDINFRNSMIPIEKTIKMYNESELEHEPGSSIDFNRAFQNIGPVIIERLFNKSYDTILNEELLVPCSIIPSNSFDKNRYFNTYPNKKTVIEISNLNLYFGIQTRDIAMLYSKLKNGELISKDNYRLMKKLTPFTGINFSESYSFTNHLMAQPFYIYDFKKSDIQIIQANEFEGHEIIINGEAISFYSYIIPQLTPYFTKFNKPKLVKLSRSNVYDLLCIENDPNQLWFMGSTKYMLAYQYAEPSVKLYLLMDNDVTVGTVSLQIDQKNNIYVISNVLIDAKYQKRGYGKTIIKESLKIFKKHGAKAITIYVESDNVAAYKTYLGAGFVLTGSFPKSYELIYKF